MCSNVERVINDILLWIYQHISWWTSRSMKLWSIQLFGCDHCIHTVAIETCGTTGYPNKCIHCESLHSQSWITWDYPMRLYEKSVKLQCVLLLCDVSVKLPWMIDVWSSRCICDTLLQVQEISTPQHVREMVNNHSEINRVHRIPMIVFARALRGALGNILSNRAYWARMGPTRYIEFSTSYS